MFGGRLLMAFVVIVGVPAATVAYIALADWLAAKLPGTWPRRVRPWLWVGPVLAFLLLYLIYPALNTVYLSFFDSTSTNYVGLENYRHLLSTRDTLEAVKNNVLWIVGLTSFAVVFGLAFAILFDRVSYESAAKATIFLPMAISYVAAGIIWKLMYDYRPPSAPQTGTLNAVLVYLGRDPVTWLVNRTTNNPALVTVGIWIWTGFALVILSAALKNIPYEIIEAARVDGASEWQVLTMITIPMIRSTIAVVATTIVIFALKAFDIVYVMTNGAFGTDVLANRMYKEMFNFRYFGRASAIAVVLLLAIAPVMVINIRRFQEQEATR